MLYLHFGCLHILDLVISKLITNCCVMEVFYFERGGSHAGILKYKWFSKSFPPGSVRITFVGTTYLLSQ